MASLQSLRELGVLHSYDDGTTKLMTSTTILDMRSVRTFRVLSRLRVDELAAFNAIGAIKTGDLDALRRLLQEQPELATARIARRRGTLTLLHVASDWPGHFPNGAKTVVMLLDAGADVNARSDGANSQTPLDWAASSDDVEILDALLDAGADVEAPGAFNHQGGPLDNAVGFGQQRGPPSFRAWRPNRPLARRRARA